jgi:hypothetical protein
MEIIIHRVNTLNELKDIHPRYGVEIDIRSHASDLVLNHEPFSMGDRLIDYLDEYKHGTLILNIKESGIEDSVIELVKNHSNIKSYFLLDIEFPYLYNASKNGQKNMAIRFSEFESIDSVKKFINKVKWVWIDTFNKLPISNSNSLILKKFNTCLVCPERWNRKDDILKYKQVLKNMNFDIDAVMTSKSCIDNWQ